MLHVLLHSQCLKHSIFRTVIKDNLKTPHQFRRNSSQRISSSSAPLTSTLVFLLFMIICCILHLKPLPAIRCLFPRLRLRLQDVRTRNPALRHASALLFSPRPILSQRLRHKISAISRFKHCSQRESVLFQRKGAANRQRPFTFSINNLFLSDNNVPSSICHHPPDLLFRLQYDRSKDFPTNSIHSILHHRYAHS